MDRTGQAQAECQSERRFLFFAGFSVDVLAGLARFSETAKRSIPRLHVPKNAVQDLPFPPPVFAPFSRFPYLVLGCSPAFGAIVTEASRQ